MRRREKEKQTDQETEGFACLLYVRGVSKKSEKLLPKVYFKLSTSYLFQGTAYQI